MGKIAINYFSLAQYFSYKQKRKQLFKIDINPNQLRKGDDVPIYSAEKHVQANDIEGIMHGDIAIMCQDYTRIFAGKW